MYRQKQSETKIDYAVILLVFALFMAAALVMLLYGEKQYKVSTSQMAYNSSKRNVAAYIEEKTRQNNCLGTIRLSQLKGEAAIEFDYDVEENPYKTYIYALEDGVYELTVIENAVFSLDAGHKLAAVRDWQMVQEGSLIKISYVDEWDKQQTLYVNILAEVE